MQDYVERRAGAYHITGTRIALDSVIEASLWRACFAGDQESTSSCHKASSPRGWRIPECRVWLHR
jgi:hypothetical protein